MKMAMIVLYILSSYYIEYIGDCSLFVDIVDDRFFSFFYYNNIGDMGEFNVMIAEKEYRRKGYGYYTVLLVLMWAIRYLKLKEFFVKIKETNTASIKMFEKIGFKFVNYSKYFKENEYRLKVDNELSKRWIQELGMPIKMYLVCLYKENNLQTILQIITSFLQ